METLNLAIVLAGALALGGTTGGAYAAEMDDELIYVDDDLSIVLLGSTSAPDKGSYGAVDLAAFEITEIVQDIYADDDIDIVNIGR